MKKTAISIAVVAWLIMGWISAAFAQTLPVKIAEIWYPQSRLTSSISVTSSSAATALPTPGSVAYVCNTGSTAAAIAFGGSTITATATGSTQLAGNTCWGYDLNFTQGLLSTYIAAVTATGSTTLTVEAGQGTPPLSISSSGGGSGGGTSSNFGATFPTAGTAVGMSQAGNMVALTGTSGNLNVECANCSGSGASAVDEASYTAGTSVLAPAGGFFQTTATTGPLTTGQQGMVQMTAQRAFFTNLRNSSGVEIGTAGAPVQVSLANTAANATGVLVTGTGGTFPVSQATAANLNATVVGTGTFAVQAAATFNAETTKVIGTVRNLGNAGAITDFAGQNAASPANAWLFGCQFNTTPTTITSGNASPCQLDNAGNVLVRVSNTNINGAAAIANSSPVTAATINVTPTSCSGTMTTGGTAQNAFSAQATLHGFTIVNIDTSAAEALWISFTGTATPNTVDSFMLNPASATASGGSFITPLGFGVNTALSVVGATTGHKYSCTRW